MAINISELKKTIKQAAYLIKAQKTFDALHKLNIARGIVSTIENCFENRQAAMRFTDKYSFIIDRLALVAMVNY